MLMINRNVCYLPSIQRANNGYLLFDSCKMIYFMGALCMFLCVYMSSDNPHIITSDFNRKFVIKNQKLVEILKQRYLELLLTKGLKFLQLPDIRQLYVLQLASIMVYKYQSTKYCLINLECRESHRENKYIRFFHCYA